MPTIPKPTDEELSILAQAGWTAFEIATAHKVKITNIQRRASQLGLKLNRSNSLGNAILRDWLRTVFPGAKLEEEYHLGERLRLDFYLPDYNLAVEFDGIQHREYNEFFHGSPEAYAEARSRDQRKNELCDLKDITLVRYTMVEEFSADFLQKLALANTQRATVSQIPEKTKPKSIWSRPPKKVVDPEQLARQKEARHDRYQQAKLWKETHPSNV